MKLTPSERAQLTGLLGALGSGLSGSTALSIFGNIEGDIQSRADQQRSRRQALQNMLIQQQYNQQAAAASRAASLKQFLLQQQVQAAQDRQSSLQDFLTGTLIPELAPKETTTTTESTRSVRYTDASGVQHVKQVPYTTTVTSGTSKIPYQEALQQLGAFGVVLPGGLGKQAGALQSAVDAFYNPDHAFYQSLTRKVQEGMAAGASPNDIMRQLTAAAASNGYGSPEEQSAIESTIGRIFDQTGYRGGQNPNGPAGPTTNPVSQQSSGPSLVGGVIGDVLGALGVGGAALGARYLGKAALNQFVPGRAEAQMARQSGAAGYEGPAMAGRADPTLGGLTGELQQAAQSVEGGIQSLLQGPRALPAEAANVTTPDWMFAQGRPQVGPNEPALSPMQRAQLGEGQGLEAGLRGGTGAYDVMGALNSIALPLQALDMWAQNRNTSQFYDEWSRLPLQQRQQYIQSHASMFPSNVTLSPSGNIVDQNGYIYDPMTGQRTTSAEA